MRSIQRYADGIFQTASLLVGLLFMFLPLVLVYSHQIENSTGGMQRGAQVSVGVAVMLRTTFRRLLRVGTTNLLRTSLGAFSRTSARTMTRSMTRRVVRTSTRVLLGMLTIRSEAASNDVVESQSNPVRLSWMSLGLGVLALALSFAFVASELAMVGDEGLQAAEAEIRYSIVELSMLAACPLLIYAAAACTIARRFGSRIRIHTALDGLVLQAYFAGAGSFLPMTTDIEYDADETTRFRISASVLIFLFAAHVALQWMASLFDLPAAALLSSFMLIYCFVYSFPIRPLEGFSVWNGSKGAWLLIWAPILFSFLTSLPAAFVDVM